MSAALDRYVEAIPPNTLTKLVDDAISNLVNADSWKQEQIIEKSERELLLRIAEGAA